MERGYDIGDDIKRFSFKATTTAEKVTIEWRGDLAVLPQDFANVIIAKRYGYMPSDDDVELYNMGVDESGSKPKTDTKKNKEPKGSDDKDGDKEPSKGTATDAVKEEDKEQSNDSNL